MKSGLAPFAISAGSGALILAAAATLLSNLGCHERPDAPRPTAEAPSLAAPVPARPAQPQQLTGVAVLRDVSNEARDIGAMRLFVCSRTDLHNCRIRWSVRNAPNPLEALVGGSAGPPGYQTADFDPVPVLHAVPSCDQQEQYALTQCTASQVNGVMSNSCLNGWGVLYSGRTTHPVDPRDAVLADDAVRIECAEGVNASQFSGDGYSRPMRLMQ